MDEIQANADRVVKGVVAYVVVTALAIGCRLALGDESGAWLGALAALVVVTVVVGLRWIGWFRSLYDAVAAADRARYPQHAATWSWFVPLGGVLLTWWLVQDMWRAPEAPGRMPPPPRPVVAWYGFWVASQLLALSPVGPLAQPVLLAASAPFAVRTVRILTARVRELESLRVLTPAAA